MYLESYFYICKNFIFFFLEFIDFRFIFLSLMILVVRSKKSKEVVVYY